MAKNKEKKAKKEEKELTKRQRVTNKIVTIFQVLLIVLCVIFSIFIIANPGGLAESPEECRTGVMIVLTDSMEPTIKTNDIIFGDDVPNEVLPLGTVITFAKKLDKGFILDTHRIVGYYYSFEDSDNKVKYGRVYQVQGEIENYDDFINANPEYKLLGYITRGDKYTLQYGATIENPTIYGVDKNGNTFVDLSKDDAGYRSHDEVLAVWSGNRIGGVGSVIKFLQQPVAFALIILLPLVLLFGYNVFLLVKMIIAEKTRKAREAAIAEVSANQIDEEEIKRKAIEEYLASLKKEEENKEE